MKLIHIDALQDWEKLGNYYNWQLGLPFCPSLKILPFESLSIPKLVGTDITAIDFIVKGIAISGSVKSYTGDNYVINVDTLTIENGIARGYVYYKAQFQQAEMPVSGYEYYLKLYNGSTYFEFKSDPFCYVPPFVSIQNPGAFSKAFSNAFNTSETGGSGTDFLGITITASNLPNIFPDNYSDKIYLPLAENRIIRKGRYILGDHVTSELHETITEPHERSRRIQTAIYDRYELEIIVKENNDLQLLEYAESVTIEDVKNDKIYTAKIISGTFSEENLGDTQIRRVKFKFYDINGANYKDNQQPVSDILKTQGTFDVNEVPAGYPRVIIRSSEIIKTQSNKTILAPDTPFYIYTSLLPKLEPGAIEDEHKDKGDRKLVFSRSSSYQFLKFVFYLGADDANLVMDVAQRCSPPSGIVFGYYLNVSYVAKSIVFPEKEIVAGAVDLYKITISIPHEIIDFFPYP